MSLVADIPVIPQKSKEIYSDPTVLYTEFLLPCLTTLKLKKFRKSCCTTLDRPLSKVWKKF